MVKLQASSIHAKCFRDRFRTRKIVYGFHSLKSSVIAIWLWLFICCKKKKKKKKCFSFEKIFMFFTEYKLFAEKNVFIWKKSFILQTEKNFFYRGKYMWNCKKIIYLIWEIFFIQKMLVLQMKYKSFLYIHSAKKIFLIIKNSFVKTSWWTQ